MVNQNNVIVILTDSMRTDHLGCYGNKWIKTPNIDRFASESILFENAYSEGLPTLPTRTACFTGRYTLPFRGWQGLEANDILLSEILWTKQMNSAIISDCWHLHEPTHNNYGRGFRQVQWIRGQEHDPYITNSSTVNTEEYYPVWKYSDYERKRHRMFKQYLENTSGWKSNEDTFVAQTVKAGAKWLEECDSSEPFLLWLDCFDPHAPYDPRFPPYDKMYETGWESEKILWIEGFTEDYPEKEEVIKQARANYAGEVSLVDEWTGIFLEKIEELGFLDNTLIIYLSDHGEPLGDHGFITKRRAWPYDELSHIPFIIRLPDNLQKGRRMKTFINTPDVMPTILGYLGIDVPPRIHGRNLMQEILGEDNANANDFAVSGHYNISWSIRNEEWSLYLWLDSQKAFKNKRELYRLKKPIKSPEPKQYRIGLDVLEKTDVSDQEHEIADMMEIQLRRFIQSLR